MTTLQEYLDQEHKLERGILVLTNTSGKFYSNLSLTQEQTKELEGRELDLSDYPNLEIVQIDGKHLKSSLTKLELGNNFFVSLEPLKNLNELVILDISDNNLSGDLTPLQDLVNLEELYLRNKLSGSLKPLQKMNKLKILEIVDTDIDSGLEYLPDS